MTVQVRQSKTIPWQDYPVAEEPDLEIMSMDVGCSQFHIMLRHMQRDHGMISDNEMALAERVMNGRLAYLPDQHRVRYNPMTGHFDKRGLVIRKDD